ncbi:MAG: hypothetical protein ACLSBH_05850 [Coprobacillus cateniformis]
METKDILGLLGGLALFLYGMKMMSDGLLDGAGIKLEYILEKLTNHKLKSYFGRDIDNLYYSKFICNDSHVNRLCECQSDETK